MVIEDVEDALEIEVLIFALEKVMVNFVSQDRVRCLDYNEEVLESLHMPIGTIFSQHGQSFVFGQENIPVVKLD